MKKCWKLQDLWAKASAIKCIFLSMVRVLSCATLMHPSGSLLLRVGMEHKLFSHLSMHFIRIETCIQSILLREFVAIVQIKACHKKRFIGRVLASIFGVATPGRVHAGRPPCIKRDILNSCTLVWISLLLSQYLRCTSRTRQITKEYYWSEQSINLVRII